ncbi:hemerythrin domain-containing protein [Extensimonas vulgaris]|uniref:Hemerythrin-like domain-containing protein n=1 Tax=Extensimonas vulgaris TaxID=1031594 RepID=A0A369AM51_9BURK|nr:hemerythrin domain-containing protein [Extensimonas vulgaris]RCX10173.1 hemerythrin-like domain-containing protein [Extensimonas vulgaris]TWI39754.1 hemerythrin-like domain-containing protein [Extensimonas vulgaris]TXD17318.1 hemerythrin domain-containing protein [Extensimonas vulgaris]
MRTSQAFPGLHTPAAGFEQPFAMLEACHERVQRMLALLQKLCAHLRAHGCDDAARQAARDVLRYFDQAGPLHHEDEEKHLFPLLRVQGNAEVRALVERLAQDHVHMATTWAQLRMPLLALANGQRFGFRAQEETALDCFAAHYARHIKDEEQHAYPAAQKLLEAQALLAMGQEMAARRGARPPPSETPK